MKHIFNYMSLQQTVAFLQGDSKIIISALMQSTVENIDRYI